MVTDPWFYLAAIPALLIQGIAKGGFAGGLGILAVPMMALALPVSQAAGILLPILLAMDAFAVWAYRRAWDGGTLLILLPAALIGNLLGTLTFRWFSDAMTGAVLGVIAVGFTLHYWTGGADAPPAAPNGFKGMFWGTVSGFTSFVSHAGGPPLSVYLLPLRMEKTIYAGTCTLYFAFINVTKLPAYYYLGQLSRSNLTTALVLSPLAPLGVYLGLWLHGRFNQQAFYRICYLLVFVSGVKLLVDAGVVLLAALR